MTIGRDPYTFLAELAPSDTYKCAVNTVSEGDHSSSENRYESRDSTKKAINTLIRLLSRREYSELELKTKLTEKSFSEHDIRLAIIEVQHLGYQSNTRFCESFTRYKASQGKGPLLITQALKQKGISNELIHLVFSELEINWLEIARRLYNRKFPAPTISQKDRAKRQRFLSSRGFDFEVINNVVK